MLVVFSTVFMADAKIIFVHNFVALLTILKWKFIEIPRSLAVCNLFDMFTQLIKFYTFYYHLLKSIDV